LICAKKAMEAGRHDFDWMHQMPDGTLMPTKVSLVRVKYGDDYILAGYTLDMREYHRVMQELMNSYESSELQLAKLNLMIQATKIGLWDMEIVQDDPSNTANTIVWSDEFRHLLGFSDETDFPNVLSSLTDRLHPEDRETAFDKFNRHVLDRTGKTPYDTEYRLLKKNGEYANFRASGETIRDENGNPLRIAGALMDITKAKNLLLDTERKWIEAEAASKAKSEFLSHMSHEMLTPMNAIMGLTHVARIQEGATVSPEECLDMIDEAARKLLQMIQNLLETPDR